MANGLTTPRGRGQPSLFKNKTERVQGYITKVGSRRFSVARQRLAELAGVKPTRVSDADVIEFLARGEQNTRAYFAGTVQ